MADVVVFLLCSVFVLHFSFSFSVFSIIVAYFSLFNYSCTCIGIQIGLYLPFDFFQRHFSLCLFIVSYGFMIGGPFLLLLLLCLFVLLFLLMLLLYLFVLSFLFALPPNLLLLLVTVLLLSPLLGVYNVSPHALLLYLCL